MSRRNFGKLLGVHTVLFSSLGLAACGSSSDDDSSPTEPTTPTIPKDYPTATPITEVELKPTTIGSYQRKNGYFTWEVSVNGVARGIEVYIPDGARQREYWIGITLPNGVKSNEFLTDAGWFEVADAGGACLMIMKPASDGVWADAQSEQAYVTAAMDTLVSSGPHYSAFTYHYVVGYGAGAAPLQLFSASNPLSMISQVYLDATADSAYNSLLKAAGSTQVGSTRQPAHMDFAGALDINGNAVTQQRTFAAQYYRDIPTPTWFVGETSDSLLAYWASVNRSAVVAMTDTDFGQVYWQDKEVSNALATADNAVRAQTAVGARSIRLDDPAVTRNVYRFLTQYSGYDNNSVYGHYITQRLDYRQAIANGNMIYKDHAWTGSETQQTYIVYVPESVKKQYSLTQPAPVLFATHGAGQTAFVFFEATDIKDAAEKYGFIAVTYDTTTTEYLTDLVGMVKDDCRTLGVAADDSRLYIYGHSAGGGATTGFARDATLVGTFAAFGITSGLWRNPSAGDSTKLLPMYEIYGEYDYWPMKLGPLAAGDWRGSQGGQYASSARGQDYWLQRLIGRTLDEEMAAPSYTLQDGLSRSLIPQNTSINVLLNPTATDNRYRTYTWSRDGIPLFVWGQCFGRGHNMIPSDLGKLWEEWFSKWQRGSQTDTLLFWQDGVGNGAPRTQAQLSQPV